MTFKTISFNKELQILPTERNDLEEKLSLSPQDIIEKMSFFESKHSELQLEDLPAEVLLNITSNLSLKDLSILTQVNKRLQNLCNDPHVWEETLNKSTNIINPIQIKNGLYTIHILKGHQNRVECFCKKGNVLYSGSSDGIIKVWDLYTNQCVATLQGHQNDISCLCVKGDFLYSGSSDGTIKVWDLTTNQCMGSCLGHKETVTCLCTKGDLLYSSSREGTIKVWDLTTLFNVGTLEGHCFCIGGNFLYSGLSDGTIKILNLTTNECIATLQGHQDLVKCLCTKGNFLYSCSKDNTIKIWDLTNNQCVASLDASVDCLYIEGNFLYSGSFWKGALCFESQPKIKIWDLSTNQGVISLKGHKNSVTSLCKKGITSFYNEGNSLYSGSSDGTIKVWDLAVTWPSLIEAAEAIYDRQDLSHFTSFGEACKNAIYKQLHSIEQFSGSNLNHTKDAFLNRNNTTTTNEKRARAIYRVIAQEILSLFQSSTWKALSLFKKLPSRVKNEIYGQLQKIMKWKTEYFPQIESAFLDLQDREITTHFRQQALENYMSLNLKENRWCLVC
ncbi:MAG TPA: F-box/WD40 repeat-containing protein [Rhabdochlamydiaceae bacterium]|nr:F-box/WD40 repeat-containing protein [Rhabdochlamydiaceae bacterium]